ncbi:MAG TPA: SIR2 family protein [Candidatus Deferrimicrobiaceae bacterium]|jgi:hypothetical protein
MVLHPKEALISAIDVTRKPVAFLVGAPFSADNNGKGVPDVIRMLDIVREVILETIPSEIARYDKEIEGKIGPIAYQAAMSWLQANVHQDAVNAVVRRAVLRSCLDIASIGGPNEPTTDGDPANWFIPQGTKNLAALVCNSNPRYQGPILTPNFDPLLSLAIREYGKRPSRRVLDTDGSLPREIEEEPDVRSVVHLHGYWRGSDTLHTPTQLHSPRPKLKAALQHLLRKHLLVVVAYGGWDDVFTTALSELLHDDQAEIDVLWCFRETDSEIVRSKYKRFLDSVAPAIVRGRFRGYGGIDCHSIFAEINTSGGGSTVASPSMPLPMPAEGPILLDSPVTTEKRKKDNLNSADRIFTKRLDEALVSFSSQPKVWVEPILCKSPEVANDAEAATKINLSDMLSAPKSTIIKAPPQFGLTCLAHYLVREAWRSQDAPLWIYLDSKSTGPHKGAIEKGMEGELALIGCVEQDIKCIVLDSWTSSEKDAYKLLRNICSRFANVPIIVMQTMDSNKFLNYSDKVELDREFEVLFLWALPLGHVRKVVSDYNEIRHIGDEDKITKKVVSDLEVLNVHRTPFNCLTLLKVSEIDFDESPVNRSEMIKRVLFLLFNVDDIPTYKVRPDLKDSEYVLGYFCEQMLRDGTYSFTRDYFLSVLERCCKERFIDLEVQVVFDVLYSNNILIKRGDLFSFRFAFWIYYFAAQRMLHSKEFANFIYEDMRYTKYPEIMEFYTGIDRQREDALNVLIRDIGATCDKIQDKCGLPDGLNPYRFAQWTPSDALLEQMQDEISNGVSGSNLPASVKDHYADSKYDRKRPYDQDIRDFLAEYSYVYMVQAMRAGARALRNSDYVEPETKRQLLSGIMRCWEQVSKVLMILTPLLAERGRASFDGQGYLLIGDFGDTTEERILRILGELPNNVVNWFQDDLFSQKMGPLLIDQYVHDSNDITKHELILMLTNQRPRGWKIQVQHYIASIAKNSFYLWDVSRTLRHQYSYSYASSKTLSDIEYLIKMAAAKHLTGSKNPGIKLINKIVDAIPSRGVKTDGKAI